MSNPPQPEKSNMVGVSRFHYHHYFLFRFVLENHRMVASV
jgi:hypothetical protein